jgi:predicted transcriptional regulator
MSKNTLRLFDISEEYMQALDELMSIDDLPEEVIKDTMESLSGDFEEKAKNTGLYVLSLLAEAKAVEEAEKRMSARKKSLNNQATRLKDYIHNNMEHTKITNIESPEIVLKLQKNPGAVVIDDNDKLPSLYKKTETMTKILKADIAKALKAGLDVTGAHLQKGTRLVIT